MMDIKRFDVLHYALKCAVPVACMACAGCDIELPSLRTATEKVAKYSEQQVPKEPVPASASQVDGMRTELTYFASSRLKIIETDIVQIGKEISEISTDRKVMSERVSELSGKVFADKEAQKENALLVLLKDKELNRLAVKHIGEDFSLLCTEFVSKVRDAYANRKRKEDSLAANRRAFEAAIEESKARDSKAERETESEMRRLEKKISADRRRLRYMHSSIVPSDSDSRRKRDRDIRTLENEISRSEYRLSQLRTRGNRPSSVYARRQALQRLDAANREVEKSYGDDVTAFQVAEEYEKSTVKKLEEILALKERSAHDRKYLLDRQKLFVSSLVSDMEKLDAEAIGKIRADVEKIFSWDVEDAKKGLSHGGSR